MDFEQSSTRRHFIKTAGAAIVGTAAASMLEAAAVANAETPSNDVSASLDEIIWDEEYDVLVVGGGCAGMVAATVVATEGEGATCLLLEKGSSAYGSGNSIFSWLFCTKGRCPKPLAAGQGPFL